MISLSMCLFTAALAAAPAAPTVPQQKTFATPEQAAEALVSAAEKFDVPALKEILGPDGIDLVVTEDPVMDKKNSEDFAATAREKMKVTRDKNKPSRASVVIGNEDWPMPVPIVQKAGRWSFDSKSGREEVLARRIGRNELDAIEICEGYVEAQHDYASEKHDGAEVDPVHDRKPRYSSSQATRQNSNYAETTSPDLK